jgi:hypothetical protein
LLAIPQSQKFNSATISSLPSIKSSTRLRSIDIVQAVSSNAGL